MVQLLCSPGVQGRAGAIWQHFRGHGCSAANPGMCSWAGASGLCVCCSGGCSCSPRVSRPQQRGGSHAAGSALHVLAASPVAMFSFPRMSGLFLPFKAWHLRGPSGYGLGNVGIAGTFCTASFKQKQTQKT